MTEPAKKQVPVVTRLDINEINNALRAVEKRIDKKLSLLEQKIIKATKYNYEPTY